MRNLARLDVLVWTLVFGGLILFGPGFALQRAGQGAIGWLVVAAGAVAIAAGAVLLWVRSRVSDPPGP